MKKKILSIALVIGLTGCAMPQVYDNNEYGLLAGLETSVRLTQEDCGDNEAIANAIPALVREAELLTTYTFYIPKNSDVYEMSKILRDDIREFEAQYEKGDGNPLYCKLKTKQFIIKARDVLETVGKKLRK